MGDTFYWGKGSGILTLKSDFMFQKHWASPVAQMVKNLPAMQETQVRSSIPGSGRSPEERSGNPLQYSRLENFMEKRSLVGSPWDCKELDMTERLSLSLE